MTWRNNTTGVVFGSIATTMPIFVKIGVGHVTPLVHSLVHPLLIIYEREFFWHILCHDAFIISYFKSKNSFDKVLSEMVSVCPPRIPILLCFELEQIGAHIYNINGGHLYSKCELRFALSQSIAILGFRVGTQKPFLGEPCQNCFRT